MRHTFENLLFGDTLLRTQFSERTLEEEFLECTVEDVILKTQ